MKISNLKKNIALSILLMLPGYFSGAYAADHCDGVDGVVTASINSPYVKVSMEPECDLKYEDANQYCLDHFGTTLASIDPNNAQWSEAEQGQAMTDLCTDASCWIGLRYNVTSPPGFYYESTGLPISSYALGTDYDSSPADGRDCMIVAYYTGVWDNENCNSFPTCPANPAPQDPPCDPDTNPYASMLIDAFLCEYSEDAISTPTPTPPPGCNYNTNGSYDMLLMLLLACGIFYGRKTWISRR